LGGLIGLRAGGDCQKAIGAGPEPVQNSADSQRHSFRKNAYVRNQPTGLTDPQGQYPRDQHHYFTFALAVLANKSESEAGKIAEGADAMDNFRNATTGLFLFGWVVNFSKHFGVPCAPCTSTGFALGAELHLVEDNAPGGPHQIIPGYGLGNRILSSFAHVGLSLIGSNPDRSAANGAGFVAAWHMLSPGNPYPGALEDARRTINANGLTIVGTQVINGGSVSSLGDVHHTGGPIFSSTNGGVTVNVYQQPGSANFYADPNVRAIQAAFSLPGSDPMREAEALYLYQVYGTVNSGGFSSWGGSGAWGLWQEMLLW
jgi:hypothetical protein